jgi:argininosuccinate lyase
VLSDYERLSELTMRTGRFSKPVPEIAQRYSQSVSFDWRLYRYDIAGSIAHAAALTQAEIITVDERQKIESELRVIEKEIESGKFEWDRSLEDVHMNIEAVLTKRIGGAGAKLHTARSFDVDIVNVFDVRGSLAERTAIGAPSPENVAVQIVRWRSELFDR